MYYVEYNGAGRIGWERWTGPEYDQPIRTKTSALKACRALEKRWSVWVFRPVLIDDGKPRTNHFYGNIEHSPKTTLPEQFDAGGPPNVR